MRLSKISSTGSVALLFSTKMHFPPLETFVELNDSSDRKLIDVKVFTGEE